MNCKKFRLKINILKSMNDPDRGIVGTWAFYVQENMFIISKELLLGFDWVLRREAITRSISFMFL